MRRKLLRTSAMILAVYMALTGSMTALQESRQKRKGRNNKTERGEDHRKEAEDKKAEEEKAEEKKAEETKTEEKGTEEKEAEDKEAGKETGKPEEVVYIGIDNSHILKG